MFKFIEKLMKIFVVLKFDYNNKLVLWFFFFVDISDLKVFENVYLSDKIFLYIVFLF